MPESPRHLWITGQDDGARVEAADAAAPAISADCHRRLRGPYTGVGTILRALIPTADPASWPVVQRHTIEVLSVAPELGHTLTPMPGTLTSNAPDLERTRWYSRLRTRRMAHGIIDLLRELTGERNDGPLVLGFDRIDRADETDQEFLTLALRRLDPRQVRLVITTETAELPEDLLAALNTYAETTAADSESAPADAIQPTEDEDELAARARAYVWTECTAAEPLLALAYERVPAGLRAGLHDERAEELEARQEKSLELGAIPYHRVHGSDPTGAGNAAMHAAAAYCTGQGYYHASLEIAENLLARVDETDFVSYYIVQTRRAQSLAALDRPEECEPLYFDLLSRTPMPDPHMSLYYALGMLFTRLYQGDRKDHNRARAYLNTSIALANREEDPSSRAFHSVFMGNGKALAEMHMGNLEESLKLVTAGIERLAKELNDDEHRLHRSVLHHNRAQVLAGLGRPDEALVEFDYVIEVDPRYPEYWFDRGSLHLKQGRIESALADYTEATRLGPPFPEVFYNRGEAYSAAGDLKSAVAEFAYVLDLEPDHLEARISLASLLLTAGDAAESAAVARAGLGFAPDSARLHCTLGLALADLGDLDGAEESYDRALRLDPTLAEAQMNRAVVAFQQERFEAVIEDLSAVAAAGTENPDLFQIRGNAYESVGEWDLAIADYTRALSDPECDRAELLYRRAHCLTVIDLAAQANSDLRSLLALGDSPYDAQVRALLTEGAAP